MIELARTAWNPKQLDRDQEAAPFRLPGQRGHPEVLREPWTFQAVIEASSSYRWLCEMLEPLGTITLAHPLRLRAIVSGRAKTDKLDAALLAKLLRGGLIPASYVPPRSCHELREITRARARLSRRKAEAISDLHGIGPYSALLIVAEFGEPWRFHDGRLVGAYAGLTSRLSQSGDHAYYGHITHQDSPWLWWILVQAAIHVVKKDPALRNF